MDQKSSPWNPVLRMGAGAFAGVFATVLTHPIDVVRARLTVQSQTDMAYRGVYVCVCIAHHCEASCSQSMCAEVCMSVCV